MAITSNIGAMIPSVSPQSLIAVAAIGGITLIIYGAVVVISRLLFHPLAKIPGPFLARVSYIYEFYQDVILGGNYVKAYPKIHAKYGALSA